MKYVSIDSRGEGCFELAGDLVISTVPTAWRRGTELFSGHHSVKLDLNGIRRTDSSGLALLIEWMRYATSHDKEITFINVPRQMLAIAHVSSLEKVLPLAQD
jgi:phospholipid transport system transporter-binding protein